MSKKIIIPREQLPTPSAETGRYSVRFRITSEDRNRLSYWSPIFDVDPEYIYQRGTIETPGYLFLDKAGSDSVNLTWSPVTIYKIIDGLFVKISELYYYDVWIMWAQADGDNPSDWIHNQRSYSTSLRINVPENYLDSNEITRDNIKYMYVEINRPARPLSRFYQTYEFPQNSTTVDIDNNWINFGRGHHSSSGTPGLYQSLTPIGGLTNGSTYYTRTIDYTTIALYNSNSDALDDTNRINLTSTGSGTGSFTGYPLMMYKNEITTL